MGSYTINLLLQGKKNKGHERSVFGTEEEEVGRSDKSLTSAWKPIFFFFSFQMHAEDETKRKN
jgi:hypothetical protein